MEQEDQPILKIVNAEIFQDIALVLTNVNFVIDKSEFVYLVGKTGSGKSSLLKTLYADLDLRSGEVQVAGYRLDKIKRKEIPMLRRKLGIVFQDFQLLTDRSARDNLLYVLRATGWTDKDKINHRIREVLELVNLETKDYKMPYELSGGEQQRLGIARSLLNHPSLIIADEPTGNLDPDTSAEIIQLLRKIVAESDTSVLMATHDYYIVDKYPGRILRVENQRVNDLGKILHN